MAWLPTSISADLIVLDMLAGILVVRVLMVINFTLVAVNMVVTMVVSFSLRFTTEFFLLCFTCTVKEALLHGCDVQLCDGGLTDLVPLPSLPFGLTGLLSHFILDDVVCDVQLRVR